MDDTLYWLVLQRLPDTGAATLHKLHECFGSIRDIEHASHQALAGIIQGDALTQFELFRDKGEKSKPGQQALKDRNWLLKNNADLLSIDNPNYPPQLKEIHHAPPVLMVAGDINVLQHNQLAIVGSRRASPSGLEIAQHFAAELVDCGFVITSGLALGIDSAAHRGALLAKKDSSHKTTVAVVATGLNLCYPSRHEKLVQEIRENGAILSEFPLGTPPQKENFPRRNRIISGLSRGVLVVEAEEKSGSLITARYALEQNREVFAVPGSIKNVSSRGCHQLIRAGATLVESVDDILSELEHPFGQINLLPDSRSEKSKKLSAPSRIHVAKSRDALDASEQHLLNFLDDGAVSIDELSRRATTPVDQTTALLLSLEIKGWVEMSAEGYRRQ
jgi:DNA processing protein